MKTIAFDNSCDADLKRTITWQFDNAVNFVGLINLLKDFVNQSTKTFWDGIVTKVCNIDTADAFGLAVWGRILNLPRPILTIDNAKVSLSLSNYRKILKGRFALLNGNTDLGIVGNASVSDYCKYIKYVFEGKVKVSDSLDMALTFTANGLDDDELLALFNQCKEVIIPYPVGVHDNTLSNSLRFKLTATNTPTAAMITEDHIGGLSNSSFTWN